MLELLREYKTPIIIFTLLFALLLGGYGVFTAINRAGKVAYRLSAVPADATIAINGTKVQPGMVYLEPGYYTVTATKDGFATYNQSSYLSANLRPDINISLAATSDAAKKWAKDHREDYDKITQQIEAKTTVDKTIVAKNNPITEALPFRNYLYTIDYSPDPKDPSGTKIQLDIDALPGARTSALYIVRQMGYDPTDYRINFVGLTGVFE